MKIGIDAGHGGADYGAVSPHNNLHEADAVLAIGLRMKELLLPHMDVFMTRDSDVFVPLSERSRRANDKRCDIFCSLHLNSAMNGDAHGWEVFHAGSTKGIKLAQHIANRHAEAFPSQKVRGVKTATFSVLRKTAMPAILWEGCFLSNKAEAEWVSSDVVKDEMAQALAKGVLDYFGKSQSPLTLEDRVVRIENHLGI